jgi:hypothetical protein
VLVLRVVDDAGGAMPAFLKEPFVIANPVEQEVRPICPVQKARPSS